MSDDPAPTSAITIIVNGGTFTFPNATILPASTGSTYHLPNAQVGQLGADATPAPETPPTPAEPTADPNLPGPLAVATGPPPKRKMAMFRRFTKVLVYSVFGQLLAWAGAAGVLLGTAHNVEPTMVVIVGGFISAVAASIEKGINWVDVGIPEPTMVAIGTPSITFPNPVATTPTPPGDASAGGLP